MIKQDLGRRREFVGRGFDLVTGRRVDEDTGEITELVRTFFIIYEKDIPTPSIFTDFLFDDDKKGFNVYFRQFNTKRRYGYIVVRFLNYIFTKIDNIEDLDKDLYKEYLNKYSRGELETDRVKFKAKDSDSVDIVNYVLKHFIYWLWNKRVKGKLNKMFKMKNFCKEDFNTKEIKSKDKSGTREVLIDLVSYDKFGKGKQRLKLTNVSWYVIRNLLWISERKDPMITFAIALGAFVGLRSSEVTQLTTGRLINFHGSYTQSVIDLNSNQMLRSDVNTGYIKGKRYQKVPEGVTQLLKKYHKKHMRILQDRGLDKHPNGVLFFNKRNDNALVSRELQRRVKEIGKILLRNTYIEYCTGRVELAGELRKLTTVKGNITPHSLRYFRAKLTKQINERVNSVSNVVKLRKHIQEDLGHKSLFSQNAYSVETEKEILVCLELIFDNLENFENINFVGDRLNKKQLDAIDNELIKKDYMD